MNRLLELPPEQQTPEQKKVFEQLVAGRGRILGPYKIWIHSPAVASGMEHIGTYLNKKGSLSEREVEIGILVIAQHWDADYVRQAHIKMGRQVGLSQDIIDAVLAGRDPKLTDPHERPAPAGIRQCRFRLVAFRRLHQLRTDRRRLPLPGESDGRAFAGAVD